MIRVSNYLNDMMDCRSGEEAFFVLQNALLDLGFDRVRYDLMTDHPSIGKQAGFGVLQNYPEEWMCYYSDRGYNAIDPVCRALLRNTLPFCWNDLDKVSPWDRHQKIMMEEAAAAGLHQGIGLGVYGANNEIAGFGIASSQPFAMPDAYPRLVAVLAHQFHMTFLELEKVTATTQPPPHLSPMEREVLKWLSAGKSKWEIAQVVKSAPISEHTVNTHLRRIYQKLGVTGKAQAVTKALLLRLI